MFSSGNSELRQAAPTRLTRSWRISTREGGTTARARQSFTFRDVGADDSVERVHEEITRAALWTRAGPGVVRGLALADLSLPMCAL